MKITLYSIKGSAGKTPIATNIALDLGYCIGTNEGIDCYSHLFTDEQFIRVGQNEEFPKFTDDTDVDILLYYILILYIRQLLLLFQSNINSKKII